MPDDVTQSVAAPAAADPAQPSGATAASTAPASAAAPAAAAAVPDAAGGSPSADAQPGAAAAVPAAPAGAPEKYEISFDTDLMTADEIAAEEASARAAGLSNDDLQERIGAVEKARAAFRDRNMAEHAARVEAWNAEIKADKEVGGDKFDASLRGAQKVLARFGDEQLRADLEASGYGSHPGLFRTLARISAAISDDVFEAAGDQASKGSKPGALWYNHPTSGHAG